MEMGLPVDNASLVKVAQRRENAGSVVDHVALRKCSNSGYVTPETPTTEVLKCHE